MNQTAALQGDAIYALLDQAHELLNDYNDDKPGSISRQDRIAAAVELMGQQNFAPATVQELERVHDFWLYLDQPEAANKLAPEDLGALVAHMEHINHRDDVRVVVLRSEGKYFCSGYDISEIQGSQTEGSSFGEMVDAIEQCRAVTVAAIHGGVYGGATDMALACDFRVGSTAAEMFMPAARLGLHFYAGGLERYVSRLGLDTDEVLDAAGKVVASGPVPVQVTAPVPLQIVGRFNAPSFDASALNRLLTLTAEERARGVSDAAAARPETGAETRPETGEAPRRGEY